LRWFGQSERKDDAVWVKKCMELDRWYIREDLVA